MQNPLATERARVTTVFFYGVVLLLGYFLVQIFAPFVGPLGWAAVLSIFVYPFHEKLAARSGNARAAAVTTLTVTLGILGPGLVLSTAFVQESRAALTGLDREALTGQLAVTERAWNRVRGLIPRCGHCQSRDANPTSRLEGWRVSRRTDRWVARKSCRSCFFSCS